MDDTNDSCEFEMSEFVNPEKNCCTVCDGDTSNNIWYQPGINGLEGRCKLDELTFEEVYNVLIHVPSARKDLERITTDVRLLTLARESSLISPERDEDEKFAKKVNSATLTLHTVFRGNMSGGF